MTVTGALVLLTGGMGRGSDVQFTVVADRGSW